MNVRKQSYAACILLATLFFSMLITSQAAFAAPSNPVVSSSVLVTRNAPVIFDANFGEAVDGFELSDINVVNGTASNLVDAGAGIDYTFDVTPTADGDVIVTVPAGVVTGRTGGEANNASDPAVMVYDTTGATPVMSSVNGNPTNISPVVVRVDFGENTTGFIGGDLIVVNALVGTVTNVDGSIYDVEMVADNPAAVTQITVNLPASVSTDVAGNENQAATELVIDYDPVVPTPQFSTTSGNPTAVSPIPYTVDFGEPITGLDAGDFTVTNGAVINLQTTDSQTWTFDVTPPADGEVTIELPAGTVQDSAANNNPTGQTNIVFAASSAIPAITSTVGVATNQASFPVTVEFGQVVSGFDQSDLQVTNGAISNFSPAGDASTFTFDFAPAAEGAVTIDIPDSAAQTQAMVDTGAAPQFNTVYDITPPTAVIATTEADPTTAPNWPMTVQFSEEVVGMTAGDLTTNGTGSNSAFSSADNQLYSMTYTPGYNTTHNFNLAAGAATDLAGNASVAATTIAITSNSPIKIGGVVFTDRGVTRIGAGKTVSLLINGVLHPTSVLTDANGYYEFVDADINPDTVLTTFLDGNPEAGGSVYYSPQDRSNTGMHIYQDNLNLYGSINNERLSRSTDANTELARVYATPATANPNVAGTLVDLAPANGVSVYIAAGAYYAPGADINPIKATGVDVIVKGKLDLNNSRSRLWVSGDMVSTVPGDSRGANGETFDGQVFTNQSATNGSVIYMGFEGSNTVQVMHGDVNLDALDYGGATTSHTMCFLENKTYQFEGFVFNGNPAPEQHLIRTCDTNGNELDGAKHKLDSRNGNYTVSNVDYRDSDNVSGIPVNPAGDSVDSGNSTAWLGAEVSGVIYDDLNNNGTQDALEPGIPGVRVNFYTDQGNGVFDTVDALTAIPAVITAADGTYSTNDIAAATYFVSPVLGNVQSVVGKALHTQGSEAFKVTTDVAVPSTADFGYGDCSLLVNTGFDTVEAGSTSLYEALYCANSGDTIEFAASLDNSVVRHNTRNRLRDTGIVISNKDLNINTVNTRKIAVHSANGGSFVKSNRPALRVTNSTLHIKGIDLQGGRAEGTAHTIIAGNNSIIFEDSALRSSLSRFGGAISIGGSGSVQFLRSRIANQGPRSNNMIVGGSVNLSFIDSSYNDIYTGNNGGGGFAGMSFGGTGDLIIRNSTFNNNRERHANSGAGAGGLRYYGGRAGGIFEITNSTFGGNATLGAGGAIQYRPNQAVNGIIAHTTIARNSSNGAGAGIWVHPTTTGTLTLKQTVVAQNVQNGVGGGTAEQISDTGGKVIYEQSYVGDEYRDGATVEVRGAAQIKGLAGNGSKSGTKTSIGLSMDLTCGSPLIDAAGTTSLAPTPVTGDQVNEWRMLGEAMDIGALEYNDGVTVSEISAATDPEIYALGEEVVVTVTYCASLVYTPGTGSMTIDLDIDGQTKQATLDETRTAATPANQLVFTYAAESGLLDLDGIDVIANTLAIVGDATLKGPGEYETASLAHAGVNLPDDKIDTFPPVITFTDDILAGPVGSDLMIVEFSDIQPDATTYAYGLSADAVCDATDSYPNALTSGIPVQFNNNANNGQTVCVTATDAAGNQTYKAASFPLNIDTTSPTVSITTSEPHRTGANPIPMTITFNEPVTGFEVSDLGLLNATAVNFTAVSSSVYTVDLVPPPAGGLVRLTVPANAATDNAGLGNNQASEFVISDVSAPLPVITINDTSPTSASPITVTVDFGESVNGFSLSDITVSNGVLGNLVNNGNRIFTLELTPIADGPITLDIAADMAVDFVGLNNLEAVQASIVYDSTPATPVVSSAGPNPTNAPIDFTVQFDEDVTGLEASELVVSNGTVTNLVAIDARNYTVTVTAAADGDVELLVPAGVAQDNAGVSNQVSNTAVVTFDGTGPIPVISSLISSPTNANSIPYTITFDEDVTGFDASDITVGNATLDAGSFSGSGRTYSFTVTSGADGDITIDIPAAAGTDPLGNPTRDATQLATQVKITVDKTGPTPVLSTAVSSPTSANPIPVTITFDEDVTGLALTDFTVDNGTLQNLAGGPQVYTVDVVPTTEGAISVSLPANTANDIAGNASLAAVDLPLFYDSSLPTPTITSSASDPTSASPIPLAIDFLEPVTGFTEGEITVLNGTLVPGSLTDTGDGQNYTALVTPTADGTVTVTIAEAVAQDASSNNNSASAPFTIVYDTTGPTPVISSTQTGPTNTNPIPVSVTFGEVVTGVELTDFVAGNGTVSDLATVDGITYTLNLTPTVDGTVTLDYPGTRATDEVGNANLDATQFSIDYDTSGPVPLIASTLTGPTSTSPVPVTVDFSEEVTGFNLADLEVGNGGVSDFTDLGNGLFGFNVTPNANGEITINIAAAAAKELYGNDSLAAVPFSIVYDNKPPQPVITSTIAGTTNANPIPITIDFGENVTGFEEGEVVVTNATLTNFVAVDAQTYTADLVPVSDGDITVNIAADVATDEVGFDSLVASQLLLTYDSRVPVPVLSSAAAPRTSSSPFEITIEFAPIEVTGFDVTDLVVINGTAGNLQTTDNITFTADITPTAEGPVEITVPAAAAESATTGLVSIPAAQLDVIYDITPPTPVISSLETSPTAASPITITVDFGEPVTGFELSDLVFGNGTGANFVNVNDERYTIDITPTAGGIVTVDVAADVAQDDVASNNLAAAQFTIDYNNGVLTIADVTVDENAGTVTVDVLLTGLLTGGTTVDYITADGTAIAPDDFTSTTGTLTFVGTDGEVQQLTIPIVADSEVEGAETFGVTLTAPGNALATIGDADADITITDKSVLLVEFSAATASDNEDTGGNLPALFVSGAITAAAETAEIRVSISAVNTAQPGVDFLFNSPTTVIIPPGDYTTGSSISIPDLSIEVDAAFENDEVFELELLNYSANAQSGDADADSTTASTHQYTITNDDLEIGPGGVALGARMWLKADAGTLVTGVDVSGWEDQSGNNNHVQVPVGVGPAEFQADALNFNPVLQFDGNDYLSSSSALIGDDGIYTKIVVFRRDSNTDNMALIGSDGDLMAGDRIHGMFYRGGTDNLAGFHGSNTAALPTDTFITSSQADAPGEYYIGILRYGAGGAESNAIRLNGLETASNTDVQSFVDLGVQIGADQMDPVDVGAGGNFLQGGMGEAIVYGSALNDDDLARVESYLALKWGITLDQSTPVSYVGADTAVFWNALTAGTYIHDIAGIGRDDASQLGQVQSTSANADAIFTITAEGEGSNAVNAFTDMDNSEFLVWANNNGASAWSLAAAPAGYALLGRTWQAQEIAGDIGTTDVTVNVDAAGFDLDTFIGDLYLVKGADLATAVPVAMTDQGGGVWSAPGVDFADGELFTLAVANGVNVEFSVAASTATDEATADNLPVILVSGVLNLPSTVDVVITGGTATDVDDYAAMATEQLALPAGTYDGTASSALMLTAPVLVDDSLVETGGETIEYSIPAADAGPGVTVADVDAGGLNLINTYTIPDTDTLLIEFSAGLGADDEDTGGNLPQLHVAGGVTSASETVDISVLVETAVNGTDYDLATPLTVTLPADDYTTLKVIPIPGLSITADSAVEPDETFELQITNLSAGVLVGDTTGDNAIAPTHIYTIINDDAVLVELGADAGADENGIAAMQLLINGEVNNPTTVSVTDSITGSANTPADYTFDETTAITIPTGIYDGTTGTAVAIPGLTIVDDSDVESPETIVLTLGTLTGDASPGDANGDASSDTDLTYTINNDDSVKVEFADGAADAEGSGGNAPMILINGEVLLPSTVVVSDSGAGSATLTEDYTMAGLETISINPGTYDGTAATGIRLSGLTIVDDVVVELDETVSFSLTSATGDIEFGDADGDSSTRTTADYTITNDDKLTVEFTQLQYVDSELTGGMLPILRVSGGEIAVDQTIEVELVSSNTTALLPDDFSFTSPVTMTINAGNYTTPAQLPLTGLSISDDRIDENDELLQLRLINPSAVVQPGLRAQTNYVIADDDTAAVTVTPVSNLTSEDGATAEFTVVLESEPTADVIISLVSDRPDEGTVPAALTFNSANWDTAQTVTVTGADDAPPVADGTQNYTIVVDVDDASTAATEYSALADADLTDISLQNQDNDSAGITVSVTDADTDESGANTATLLFVLGTQPGGEVTIPLSIDAAGLLEGSFDATSALGTSSVTLDSSNWDTGVSVTLYGVNDTPATIDGTRTFTVITGDVTTDSDQAFVTNPAIDIADPVINNLDDDSITVEFLSASSQGDEASNVNYPVIRVSGAQLDTTETVSVVISGGSATDGEDYTSVAGIMSVTVPPADYNTPVDLALGDFQVIDDDIDESPENVEFTITAVSADLVLGAQTTTSYDIVDNDTASVIVTQAVPDLTSEDGSSATFTLALGSQPTGDVVLNLASSNTAEATVQPTVTFTSANWNQPQTVTVSGVDDAVVDGPVAYQVDATLDSTATLASEYLAVSAIDPVLLQNQDDEAPAIMVTVLSNTTSENGTTATVQFSLGGQPDSGDVTIPLTLDTETEATLSVNSLTITNANWDNPAANAVVITGLDDDLLDGEKTYRLITGDPSSANTLYDALGAEDVADPQLQNADNDELQVSFAAADYTVQEGDGTTIVKVLVSGAIAVNEFTVDLAVNGAATNGVSQPEDIAAPAVQTVTLPAGDYLLPTELELAVFTVTDDSLVEGNEVAVLTLQNPSANVSLAGLLPRSETNLTIIENDIADVAVVDTVASLPEDGSDTFDVFLQRQPLGNVTILLSVDDDTVGTVGPVQLEFTPANWDQPQTATISGIADVDYIEESLTVNVEVAAGSDAFFAALPAQQVLAQVTEPAANDDDDNDGLSNAEECPGTSCTDTDGDGTPDFKDDDDDGDGVPTKTERESGSMNYLDRDTDGDLVPDGVELANGTEAGPAESTSASLDYVDTDGDLVPDHIELADGTDPQDNSDFADSDNGGLPNYVEGILLANAGMQFSDDSDALDDCRDLEGDGLPDITELRLGSNIIDANSPTAAGNLDEDSDTVTNAVEAYLEAAYNITNVDEDSDFDRDGLPDAFEVAHCTHPLTARDADSDKDGVPDVIELMAGRDIDNTTDTDGDGLPDVREIAIGSDPEDADGPTVNGAADDDGDGISNAIEAYLFTYGGVMDATNDTDSDSDRVDDATEVRNNSNPFANMQPVVWIESSQGTAAINNVNRIRSGAGQVSVLALIGNYQGGQTEYDWSNSSPAITSLANGLEDESLVFDPANLSPGVYVLEARVRRIVQGTASPYSTVRYTIEVAAGDSTGILYDDDADGIPNAQDRSNGLVGLADEIQSVPSASVYIVRSNRGTKMQLGNTSRNAQTGVTQVSESDVANYGSKDGTADATGDSEVWDFPLGLHDFEVANLPFVGASTLVVIPQSAAIPDEAEYKKFKAGEGYADFDTSGGDAVSSAAGTLGVCPAPGDASYTAGLTAGHFCIQLSITDNGPNDADGELNGLVVDPGGAAVIASDGLVITGLTGNGCSIGPKGTRGGSASIDPTLLLLLLVSLVFVGKRIRNVRHAGKLVVPVVALLTQAGCAATGTGAPDVLSSSEPDGISRTFYAGTGLGLSKLDPDADGARDKDVNNRVNGAGQLTIGADINRHLSAEFHAADLGTAGFSDDTGINYVTYGITGLYYIGKNRNRYHRRGFTGFGRLGYGRMSNSAKGEIDYNNLNADSLIYGAGVEYMTRSGLGFRGEFLSFDEDALYGQFALVYRFGKQRDRHTTVVAEVTKPTEPVVVPVPAVKVTPAVDKDEDKDGVAIPADQCLSTPPNAAVDQVGCSIFAGVAEGVNFQSGSDQLTEKAKTVLAGVAAKLKTYPGLSIKITAHTDSVGSEATNQALSDKRAAAVLAYLTQIGVDPGRLSAQAYGETRPVASNDTAQGRALNRRVELFAPRVRINKN